MDDYTFPRIAKWALGLVALTAVLSLVYGLQYVIGGPLRPTVVSQVYDVALSPDGALVATATEDGIVRLWEVSQDTFNPSKRTESLRWTVHELTGHSGPVIRVAFGRRGLKLVSVSRDGSARLWDPATRQTVQVLQISPDQALVSADVTPDSTTLVALGQEGQLHVWDLQVGQETLSIDSPGRRVVAISSQGNLIAADDGHYIQVWDAHSGDPLMRLEGQWEDPERQEEWMGHTASVTALAFSPDGKMLVSGGADKKLVFWDLESGEAAFMGEGHFAAVTRLVFASDGRSVLSASADAKAKMWRVPGGKSSGSLVGHLNTVNAAIPGPVANTILTAGQDGSIRLWDMTSTTMLHIEWATRGLQPQWGRLFGFWMLGSGLVGLVCLWGLRRFYGWSHLLTLALYILGPIIVLGLPILEAYFYPFSLQTRLEIVWPLLVLVVWYGVVTFVLSREPVALLYEARRDAPLAEQLMSTVRARQVRTGLFIGAVWLLLLVILYSVLRRFNLDISFMGHFFSFIMAGSGYTMLVSALSIALAVVLALLGALGRLSRNSIANGISGFYISLIRGTPLLVQIYIWYLGLPRLNIILKPLQAGILALGVNYGAYMTEIFRAGIQAIGKGQHEAAQALGMSRAQTLRRIVLPQAFRIVIPPIGNEFIAMMKDSSLVSVMGVWELTFRSQKIGRQYFRSIETFLIAAAFYWILTVVFQFLQGKLETYMARGERR